MTDDEAFIRAIVDSPGDDTPRLVYADWLDDRDDPRGAYLRAEAEWARPWRESQRPEDSPKLRDLAAGLDPVWVARVSRPPLGFCLNHLRFRGYRAKPSVAEIDDAERRLNEMASTQRGLQVRFPVDYRLFLAIHNGGPLDPSSLPITIPETGEQIIARIDKFYSVNRAGEPLNDFLWMSAWGFLGRFLPIANTSGGSGALFLGQSEHDFGQVLFSRDVVQHDWRSQPLIDVSPCLSTLLASISG